jgi:hypothetical protein
MMVPMAPDRPRRLLRAYHLTGQLAWIEHATGVAVLHVQETNRRARAFNGHNVTVDLSHALVSTPDLAAAVPATTADLLPGQRVTVRFTLAGPPSQQAAPMIVARQVTSHEHYF